MSLDVLLVRRWPERRAVVLTAAAAGFAAVAAAAGLADDPSLAIGVLHVLPVMLVALELGLAGGLTAAVLAIALVVAGDAAGRPELDALGVVTRSVALVAAGAIAGRFSDRMRAARAREQRVLDSGLALCEIRTGAALAAVVAEAALHTPLAHGAAVEIEGEPTVARGSSEGRRDTTPVVVRGSRIGRITVVSRRGIGPEDRAALELLALQAGLAFDNQRLLASELEAAALGTQLSRARDELGHLLAGHEDERRRVAETLHEELAQALAGVLLGLRMLRGGEQGEALADVHAQVVGVLDDVRDVATALRPSSLAQLGLIPALEGLARQSGGTLSLRTEAVPEPLAEPLRTGVYRLVQQALAAGRPATPAQLDVHATGQRLDVDLELALDDPTRLAATRAWVSVLGGSLDVEPSAAGRTRLAVRLPLDQEARAVAAEPTGSVARTTVRPGSESISR